MKIEELFRFNEWWDSGKIDTGLKDYKRELFAEISKFLDDRQIVLLTGLRRVGKTTILYQIIDGLLKKCVEPRKILYFSFDEKTFDIKDVIETYRTEVLRKNFKDAGRLYVFFDEIQKVDDWENKIKTYYDINPNIKFFFSGSASVPLLKKSRESLAGRIYEFNLKPLRFKEFLEMKGVDIKFEDMKIMNRKILPYFSEFIIKSGFPELADKGNEEKNKTYIRLSVIDRIVYRDIPKEFGRVDIEFLETLVNFLFKNPGLILNIDSLSNDMKRNKRTLMNYLQYLKLSLLINMVSNYRPGVLASSRKNKKIYPATPSLTFSLTGEYNNILMGKALETIFCSEIEAKHYFRKGGKEIDFLLLYKEILPVEIKYKESKSDIKKFSFLIRKLNLKKGIMLTFGNFGLYEKNVKIMIYPVWAFLLFKEEILRESDE